jgi:recombination associated protein RdgC
VFFRNLTLYRFPTTVQLVDLEQQLAECALKPVGALELSSRGFVSPFGRDGESLSHCVNVSTWLSVGAQTKILPGSVVNDLLAAKLDAIEKTEGRKPGGRARKRIKDDLVHELLPRAFVKPGRVDAILMPDLGLCIVDTSSSKGGETVVSEIRHALGSFPALPVNAEVAPRSVLTGWLAGEPLPEGLSLGDECELRDAADKGAVVKCSRQEMQGDEIAQHLGAGKQCTRLALTLDDRLSFVIGEDLVVRKLKLLDGCIDSLEGMERDDVRAELDARFCLFAGEIRRLFAVLAPAFRISNVEA